jgi:hypothetical protein
MRLRAASEGITATSLKALVACLREKKVKIRCRTITDGEPRRFGWSRSGNKREPGGRFKITRAASDEISLTLLGPSEGLVERLRSRLPTVHYAAYAALRNIELKRITASNQLSSSFVIRYNRQGILVSGDTGFVDFPLKAGGKKYHPHLIEALDNLAVVQVAHHGGANAHFYRAMQKAESPLARPESFLLLSHGPDDPLRPSAEFSQYLEGVPRDNLNVHVLFTGRPCADRIADFRCDVFPRVGDSAIHGDVRLSFEDGSWIVKKHAVDMSTDERKGEEAKPSTPRRRKKV